MKDCIVITREREKQRERETKREEREREKEREAWYKGGKKDSESKGCSFLKNSTSFRALLLRRIVLWKQQRIERKEGNL